MQFSLSLVFPLFMIAEFLVDLKNPHVTFRVQNARSFAPIDTRTPLHAESGDAVHCRLFRPAYGRFATCKKEKKKPFSTVAVEFGFSRCTTYATRSREGGGRERGGRNVRVRSRYVLDVHARLEVPYFSIPLFHASSGDRISICYTYHVCIHRARIVGMRKRIRELGHWTNTGFPRPFFSAFPISSSPDIFVE